MGDCFNQPIEKEVLPASLLHFTMGVCFNQPIQQVYFISLGHLHFVL